MPNDISTQIQTAKDSGYSDDDILKFLEFKPEHADKIKLAKQHYKPTEILGYLSGVDSTEKTPTLTTDKLRRETPGIIAEQIGKMIPGMGSVPGVASGVANTGLGIYDLVKSGAKKIGLGDLPEAPPELQGFAAGEGLSKEQKFTRGAEQVGEFFIPGGATTKLVSGISKLTKGSKVARVVARGLGEGASAAGITAAQTHGDEDAALVAGITGGVVGATFATIGEALTGFMKAHPRIGYAKLKFPMKGGSPKFKDDQINDIIEKAIDEKIMVSRNGSTKLTNLMKGEKGNIDRMIANNHNTPVNWDIIKAPVLKLKAELLKIGKKDWASAIDRELAHLEEAYGARPAIPGKPGTPGTPGQIIPPGQFTWAPKGAEVPGTPGTPGTPGVLAQPAQVIVVQAQEAKKIFQDLAKKAFGESGRPGGSEYDKLISAGFREGLEDAIPELRLANRDLQNSLVLKRAIDSFLQGTPGLSPRTMATVMLFGRGAIPTLALADPGIRSALAIIASRVAKKSTGSLAGPAGGAAAKEIFAPMPQPEK